MNTYLEIIKNYLSIETISYFFCEIALVGAIIFNLSLFSFFKKNPKIPRLSDYFTSCVFALNFILCLVFYIVNINNIQFYNTFLNNFLYLDADIFLTKTVINAFFLLFMFSVYKLTRTYRTRAVLANVYLCVAVLFSSILAHINNMFLTFLFLDVVIIFIYKYSSLFRFNLFKPFSVKYVLLNTIASIVLYLSTFLLMFNDSELQILVLNSLLFMAFLLKIGIFPCTNYFSFKNHTNNMMYSMLIYLFLPYLSVICFTKVFNNWFLLGDTFFILAILFLLLSVFNVLIVAQKTKNLVKFFACCSYCFIIFVVIEFLVSLNSDFAHKLMSAFLFVQTAIFTLLVTYKVNNKDKKLLLNNFKGLIKKNREYLFALSFGLLMLFFVVPGGYFKNSLLAIKNIYSYDEFGYILFVIFVVIYASLLFRMFNIILNFYNYDYKNFTDKFNKKTTLNYVAFWISILFSFFTLL